MAAKAREQGQGEAGPHSGGAQQPLEHQPFVSTVEPEQQPAILAHHQHRVEMNLCPLGGQPLEHAQRHRHLVPDAPSRCDDHPVSVAGHQRAADPRDHRRTRRRNR